MPNWCTNNITITGPRAARTIFYNKLVQPLTPVDEFYWYWYVNANKLLQALSPMFELKPKRSCVVLALLPKLKRKFNIKYRDSETVFHKLKFDKWLFGTQVISNNNRSIILICTSKWSMPLLTLETISGLYPELEFNVKSTELNLDYEESRIFQAGHIT